MTTLEARQQMWEKIYRIFDPFEPATEARLRAARSPEYDRTREMASLLERPYASGERKSVLAGPVGSGKTTELLALSERLTASRIVIFVDLWQHFERTVRDPNALDRLQAWELIGLLGLAVYRAGEERFGHRWGKELPLQAAMERLRPKDPSSDAASASIDLPKLASGLALLAGGALAGPAGAAGAQTSLLLLRAVSDASAWRWRIGLPDQRRRSDQDGEVRAVLNATNLLIGELQREYVQRLLIVVDGLDRVESEETFRHLFVDSALLGELSCDLVVSGSTRFGVHQRGALRSFKRHTLTHVPVIDRADPAKPGSGLPFFRQLVRLRLEKLELSGASPLPDVVVDRLAWASGGRAREFVTLVRELVDEIWPQGPEIAPMDAVERVIDRARRDKEEGLNRDEIRLLQEVANDPERRLPASELAERLVAYHHLLPYPNRSTWYFPHPLLTMALVHLPSGSSASGASSP